MEQVISGSIVRFIPDTYCYKWFMSNPRIVMRHKKLMSPTFTTGVNNENKWHLEFYDSCELCIFLEDSKESSVNALIQVYSPNEEKTMEQYYAHGIFNTHKFTKGSGEFLYNFPELHELCQNHGWAKMPLYQLTIICEIKHEPKDSEVMTDGNLLNDLSKIFRSGENSDLKIVTSRRQFNAHKFILAMRSPVFAAMMKHNKLMDNLRDVIEITDIDDDTVEKLLEYMYTGQVMNIDKGADKLLAAADMYELQGLKSMCSNVLIEKLTTDNLCVMLKLAVKYKANDLKAGVLDYISLNYEDDLPLISLKVILPNLLDSACKT